jgi:hypothetical protein
VAFHLKMSVSKLLDEMTYEELQGWLSYLEQRPIGWREDDRTHKLLQAQGVKEKPWALFPSLDAIYNRNRKEGFDVNNLKNSAIFQKMLAAKGGDKLNL